MGKVRDDRAMLQERDGVLPPRPAALQGCRFTSARRLAGIAAQMSDVPRRLAGRRDGYRFHCDRRGMAARDAGGVVCGGRSHRRGIDPPASLEVARPLSLMSQSASAVLRRY